MGSIQRRFVKLVITVVGHPKATLAISGVVLAMSVIAAVCFLALSTDQNKLFSSSIPFFRDYLNFVEKFPENEAIIVIVEPASPQLHPPVERWAAAADAIGRRLDPATNPAMKPYVQSVEVRVTAQQMRPYGLLFENSKRLPQDVADFKQFADLLKRIAEKPGLDSAFLGTTPVQRFYAAMGAGAAERPKEFPLTAPLTDVMTRALSSALEHPDWPIDNTMPDLSAADASDPERLGYAWRVDQSDPKRHVLLINVHHIQTEKKHESLTAISQTVEAIRNAAQDGARDFPEFKVGVTGRPALDADEMRTTDHDSHLAEALALACVFVGLVAMLRSVWLALVAEISLVVGIGWTLGWATATVGQLNLLSMVFVIALIGIGMDYLIQILTRYRREARRYQRPKAIWARVFRYVSPPISTACAGAAGAFLVSLLTNFQGAAELGLIAGGGLLLCLLAGYTVLPALLVLWPVKLKPVTQRYTDHHPPPANGWWRFIGPIAWLILLAVGAPFAFRVHFNPNLIELQAPNLESVQLVSKVQTWSSVVMSRDVALLRQVRQAVQSSPYVASTESIVDAYDNAQWLADHQNQIPPINWAEPNAFKSQDIPALASGLRNLAATYKRIGPPGDAAADSLTHLAALLATSSTQTADALANRITEWQRDLIPFLRANTAQFSPPPLDVHVLPPQLKNHLMAEDGTFALYIYPKPELNLWTNDDLQKFVEDVERRVATVPNAPAPTGIAMNIFHTTAAIQHSFHMATLYALILIVLLVYLDLRKIGQTLLAISVLAFGLPMLVIVMGLPFINQSWNFANFFALPILIGAGHEYGVFMVHRYREVLDNPRRVWRRWDVSDRALLLCAFVTSTSFGFFWFVGHHQGLKSLGWVMMVGTITIYLATVFVVRPILLWRIGDKGVYEEDQD